MWIQEFELRRGSIFVEFGLPVFCGQRRKRSCYGLPFCDAKTGNCQSYLHLSTNWTYPDSVNLVRPPNTTIPKTDAALPNSQYATDFELVSGKNFLAAILPSVCDIV
jgi:hypothetical protein